MVPRWVHLTIASTTATTRWHYGNTRNHTKPTTQMWKIVPVDPRNQGSGWHWWSSADHGSSTQGCDATVKCCGDFAIATEQVWSNCVFVFSVYVLFLAIFVVTCVMELWSKRRVILWHDVTWSFGILPVTSEVSTIKIDACCNFEGFHQKWELMRNVCSMLMLCF